MQIAREYAVAWIKYMGQSEGCRDQSDLQAALETKVLSMNQGEYEQDLKRRQEEHLRRVFQQQSEFWCPCLHDECPQCLGTGVRLDGSACVHNIACPCPKCSPRCSCETSTTSVG